VFPTQITFRNLPPSPALSFRIRELCDKLTRVHPRILNCRVAVEQPRPVGRAPGMPYYVDVQLRLPECEVGIDRLGDADLDAALRRAFLLLRRELRAQMPGPTTR